MLKNGADSAPLIPLVLSVSNLVAVRVSVFKGNPEVGLIQPAIAET